MREGGLSAAFCVFGPALGENFAWACHIPSRRLVLSVSTLLKDNGDDHDSAP
jgi:hypothetical protein